MSEDIELADERPAFAWIDEWVFDRVRDAGAYQLYGLLAMRVRSSGYKLGRKYLAERCGCSVDTIDRRLRYLVDAHVIRIDRTAFNGGSGWNKYALLGPSEGGRKSAARGAATARLRGPHGRGTQEEKERREITTTPLPPSGGKLGRRARCAGCGKDGVVGPDLGRYVDTSAPRGQKTMYLHQGCEAPPVAGVRTRIPTSNDRKDWL